ncbi:hypothetical protein F8M41_024113 [Gigaspora margarita]|uniref:Uncharacterized protein n=1 Tax=Gigaspora margarita TaxID=4874 RepID=A0A8H4AC84_GIGMA|nr:hypothetical protein F8M41_024113 [Gigaspora margarita]
MSADIEFHHILFNENWVENFKQNAERFFAYIEKSYTDYCAFTVKHPYFGLSFAIFIVFSVFPILIYIVFMATSITVIIGGALCFGLLILSFIFGLVGLVILCDLFLGYSHINYNSFIDGYLKTNSIGLFNFSKLSNGVNEEESPSESQFIRDLND